MRHRDWIDRYVKFIHSRRDRSFEFGVHDCCITACDMIKEITGKDPGKKFRGQYGIDNPIRALRLVKEHGDVDGIAEQVCQEFGWPEISPAFAGRGDLVCLDLGGQRKSLGWVDLSGTEVMAPAMTGVQSRPRSEVLRAWRID